MHNKLVINLSGQVTKSNFFEWKNDLINKIDLTNLDLTTSNDFLEAKSTVKSFKEAEKMLKQAKINALSQIYDIQELFDAIDEVVEKARQARLTLERQIKIRTEEIKDEIVQSGVDEITKYIENKDTLFKALDWKKYTDKSIFQSAIKGKRGSIGAKQAINDICEKIKLEIDNKALKIRINKTVLDTIPLKYKAVFQDEPYLLSLNENELNVVIDTRINNYNKNKIIDKSTIASSISKKTYDSVAGPSSEDIEEIKYDSVARPSSEDIEEIKFVLKSLLDGRSPTSGEVIDSSNKLKEPLIRKALKKCLDFIEQFYRE